MSENPHLRVTNGFSSFNQLRRLSEPFMRPLNPKKINPGWACSASQVSVWNQTHQRQVQEEPQVLIEPSTASLIKTSWKIMTTQMTLIALCRTICESYKNKLKVR